MSRLGKRPIKISQGVQVNIDECKLFVKGPKGELELSTHPSIELRKDDLNIYVSPAKKDEPIPPMVGTTWALITNMIFGVTEGFKKQLNLVGVGYKAAISQNTIELNLGFSHPIKYNLPDKVKATVNATTKIILESSDKQLLGQVAADIQKFRPPEPYKGKGILFEGIKIRRKAGKSGKA